MHSRRRTAPAALLALATALAACTEPPVEWSSTRVLAGEDAGQRVSLDSAGGAALTEAVLAGLSPYAFEPAGACPGSVRESAGARRYAVWWAARPDSSASLLASYSADGGRTWEPPVPVDTLDRGARGCARPAPAVAFDSTNGFAHVAYFMHAPEGGGIFYAHRMAPAIPFEPAQVVVYGETPAAVDIAAAGDALAVAYEDPNVRERQRIAVALSRTAGHGTRENPAFFAPLVVASPNDARARRPQVAVRGDRVLVAWLQEERAVVGRVGTVRAPQP